MSTADPTIPAPRRAASGGRRAAACAAAALLLVGCGVNAIPTYEEQAKAKWSDVENQYQRRADLIPNLVETVKGYARHEREVVQAVVDARARALATAPPPDVLTDPAAFRRVQEAQREVSATVGRLLAIAERYPDLKADQGFLTLQAQLEGTENRIAVARRDYIEAVRLYNTELRTFPGLLWAATLYRDSRPLETFKAGDDARATPEVKF